MEEINYPLWLILVPLITILYLCLVELRRLNSNEKKTPVTYENASEALNKIGSWTTWLDADRKLSKYYVA